MAQIGINHEWDSMGIAIARLEIEPEDAYQAFLSYAWLTGSERKHGTVASRLGYMLAEVKEWARVYQWSERASTVDAIRWTMEMKERNELIAEDNKRFVKENQEVKSQVLVIARKMLDESERLLDNALKADEVIVTDIIETADGRKIPTTTVINMKAKVSDIPRLVDTAVKASRLVQDLPTEISQVQLPMGQDLENMTVEELIALRESNMKEINAKSGLGNVDQVSNATN